MAQGYGKPHQWHGGTRRSPNVPMYSSYQNPPVSYSIGGAYRNPVPPNMNSKTFSGVVTKLSDMYGFIDESVYFHRSTSGREFQNLRVGDRVLVDAMSNPNQQNKWTATRVEVDKSAYGYSDSQKRGRSPKADYGYRDSDHKRRRFDRTSPEKSGKSYSKSGSGGRSKDSPPRHNKPIYNVKVPNDLITLKEYDVQSLKRRFSRLYIPSDLFMTTNCWLDVFPLERPFSIDQPCPFHIMHKECDPLFPNKALYDPPDADYRYSSKVMLISIPDMDEIYQKCITLTEDIEKPSTDRITHLSRLINFLVGKRKNDAMAVGGPWSPSLDGAVPEKDPSILINTAIRTCKALTGIDLTSCTKWYRFLEIYYHRSESVEKGKTYPARVETVVFFIPEVWTCTPTHLEWDSIVLNYSKILERKINPSSFKDANDSTVTNIAEEPKTTPQTTPNHHNIQQTTPSQKDDLEITDKDEEMIVIDKCEPTHYSKLDPKVMKVNELRQELDARNLSTKGLKQQLATRLVKALKGEEEKEQQQCQVEEAEKMIEVIETVKPTDTNTETEIQPMDTETVEGNQEDSKTDSKEDTVKGTQDDGEEEEEEKEMSESERSAWMKRYTLPSKPHIIVHPSKEAKEGQFECSLMSLSSLLDYHSNSNKEHASEVYLFAELFNDMLNRDFGYKILEAFYNAPADKPKEETIEKKSLTKDEKTSDEVTIDNGVDGGDQSDKKIENSDQKTDTASIVVGDDVEMKDVSSEVSTNQNVENANANNSHNDSESSSKLSKEDGAVTAENGKQDNSSENKNNDCDSKQSTDSKEQEEEKAADELKKKKSIVPAKMYTHDRSLLLSFMYFDRGNIGYILEKDCEPLIHSLGLYLSRHQVRKTIAKVAPRGAIYYRKLTDKIEQDSEDNKTLDAVAEELSNPVISNKSLLAVEKSNAATEVTTKLRGSKARSDASAVPKIIGSMINYNGSILDIEKILVSNKRSETARLALEKMVHNLKRETDLAKEAANDSLAKAKATSADLQTCRDKFFSSSTEITSLKGKLRSLVKGLSIVKAQIDPIIDECMETECPKVKKEDFSISAKSEFGEAFQVVESAEADP